jgi:hypothetical protein
VVVVVTRTGQLLGHNVRTRVVGNGQEAFVLWLLLMMMMMMMMMMTTTLVLFTTTGSSRIRNDVITNRFGR